MSVRFEQWDIVSSVGLTALVVAAGRAVDTHRSDSLVRDPYAEAFVEAANPPKPLPTRPIEATDPDDPVAAWQMMSGYLGVRSRFFDEFFATAGEAGVTQAVILAAGLDTRAHRLTWAPGTAVFEVDQPAVLEFKDQVLAEKGATPACERHEVRVDLREDWATALTATTFDPARPTAWLAEGLLPYLPPEAQEALLTEVTALSAPGSRLAVEDFGSVAGHFDDPDFRRVSEWVGVDISQLVHADERPELTGWLGERGWSAHADEATDLAAAWDRPFDPLTSRMNGAARFVTARRAG